jgi:hypothetical protein
MESQDRLIFDEHDEGDGESHQILDDPENQDLENNSEPEIEDEAYQDKELIYNENSGYNNVDKLFDEQSGESAFYEIQFRIFDKKQNKVNTLLMMHFSSLSYLLNSKS